MMSAKGAQCLSLLEDCLALQLQRAGGPPPTTQHDSQHYWIYDSGYLIYQGFVEANLKCCWDTGLLSAVRGLQFRGYISPGILLVGGSPPALHLLRAAWSRRVLKPPPNYNIALLGDVEDCTVSKVRQTSFTPLPDAVCWVILQIQTSGLNAVLDSIQSKLSSIYPEMEQPSRHILYDTLADLMSEQKIYQTAQGYFVSNPEHERNSRHSENSGRQVLLTHAEAAAIASGEIVTIREGAKTHQAIQTNLADVICGGNKSDKVMYARIPLRAPGRKLERRHSMRLLGSSKRLSTLHRAGSVRLLHNTSTENSQKKCSLFSKLFKWSKRQSSAPSNTTSTPLSMPFPPQEWFNSTVLGLHSVGTQTKIMGRGDIDWSECGSIKSRRRSMSTSRLPRRQTRTLSASPSRPSTSSTPTSSKTVLASTPKALSSASSGYNSLPRSHKSKAKHLPHVSSPLTRHTGGNSIKVEVSATPTTITADTKVDTHMTATINEPSATMTTTINGPNSTKIYLQQQNIPIRSVITFEKCKKASEKIKDEVRNENSSKSDLKKPRRPSSLYQQKEHDSSRENNKNNVNVEHLSNNIKMKFPSTETIQMEEKLIVSGNKNNINEKQKINVFDVSNSVLKADSMIDVANTTTIEGQRNNIRKASLSLSPLQPAISTDKVLETLNYKNVLKQTELSTKNGEKNNCYSSNLKLQTVDKTIDVSVKKMEQKIHSFPSLSDISLHFTSIAAQNILNGVSINSLDTLVESNEKNSLKEMSIHTDMGVV